MITTVSVWNKISFFFVSGILQFPLAKFLVAINQKRKIGDIEGQTVYRLESIELIPISSISPNTSAELGEPSKSNFDSIYLI